MSSHAPGPRPVAHPIEHTWEPMVPEAPPPPNPFEPGFNPFSREAAEGKVKLPPVPDPQQGYAVPEPTPARPSVDPQRQAQAAQRWATQQQQGPKTLARRADGAHRYTVAQRFTVGGASSPQAAPFQSEASESWDTAGLETTAAVAGGIAAGMAGRRTARSLVVPRPATGTASGVSSVPFGEAPPPPTDTEGFDPRDTAMFGSSATSQGTPPPSRPSQPGVARSPAVATPARSSFGSSSTASAAPPASAAPSPRAHGIDAPTATFEDTLLGSLQIVQDMAQHAQTSQRLSPDQKQKIADLGHLARTNPAAAADVLARTAKYDDGNDMGNHAQEAQGRLREMFLGSDGRRLNRFYQGTTDDLPPWAMAAQASSDAPATPEPAPVAPTPTPSPMSEKLRRGLQRRRERQG